MSYDLLILTTASGSAFWLAAHSDRSYPIHPSGEIVTDTDRWTLTIGNRDTPNERNAIHPGWVREGTS